MGKPLGAEDLCRLIEGQVDSDEDRPPLIALAEDLEQKFRPGLGQRHESKFVDDEELQSGQPFLQHKQTSLVLGLNCLVDERGCRGEADPAAPLTGGKAQTEGDVDLTVLDNRRV